MTRAITSISGNASALCSNLPSDAAVRVDQLVPPAGLAGEALDFGVDPLRRVILGVGLEPPAERRALVAQLLLVVLREPLDAVLARDLIVRRGRTELDLQHAHEGLRIATRLVERDQRLGRGEVVLVELEHLLERAHRAIGLLQLVAVQHRDLHRERQPVLLAAGLDLALEDADVLVDLAAGPVELLELVPATLGDVELLERVLRATVVLVDREQPLPGVDRLRAVLDLLGVEQAEALQGVGAGLVVGRGIRLAAADVGELVPLLVALVELVELGERFFVRGLVLENLLPPVRADLGLLDLGRRHLGDVDHLGRALAVGRALDLGLLELDQLLPVAALLVDREQVLDRLMVVRIELEDLLERLDRLGLVREPLEVEVRDLEIDRDLVRLRLGALGLLGRAP